MKTKTKNTRRPAGRAAAGDVLNKARALVGRLSVMLDAGMQVPRTERRGFATATSQPKTTRRHAAGDHSNRGRTAGLYFPKVTSLKGHEVNDTHTNIFNHILKNKKSGISQRQIQDDLNLPHSTVWHTLQKFRALKVIVYKQPSVSTPKTKAA